MGNKRLIFHILGILLLLESFFMFISVIVSLIYMEGDWLWLLISAGITSITGFFASFFTRTIKKNNITKRDGYFVVSMVWVLFSLFGALPFWLGKYIPSYTDAFFETMSGFTTTGASILNDIESLPHGILFWRSLTQWIGGMGMIVLSVAILPIFGIGGMQLFAAEVPGPTTDKIHPRVKETAKRLWEIYIIFTVAQIVLLFIAGMNLFDAVNHSLTTMATGGFSTKQASIAAYPPAIHYIIIIFMFIAGTNFNLSYLALHGKFKPVFSNDEFKGYWIFTLGFTLLIFLYLIVKYDFGIEKSFRDSLFQVVSLITTTGFATVDYLRWGNFPMFICFLILFFGGSAGSTSGGLKSIRLVLLFKNCFLEFKRLVHPNAIIPVRFNQKAVHALIMGDIMTFFIFYILIFVIGSIFMSLLDLDLITSMSSVITCLSNVGPGLGKVGPADNFFLIPDIGKWWLSFMMLVGRLELFTVIVLLSRAYWKQ
jgi:trk system potassium uptake protein